MCHNLHQVGTHHIVLWVGALVCAYVLPPEGIGVCKKCLLKCLPQRFLNFFLEKYKRQVCNSDQWKFINGWYVLVIISDLMTIIGSILKMEIKAKVRGNSF